eukprot:gene29477-13870_t
MGASPHHPTDAELNEMASGLMPCVSGLGTPLRGDGFRASYFPPTPPLHLSVPTPPPRTSLDTARLVHILLALAASCCLGLSACLRMQARKGARAVYSDAVVTDAAHDADERAAAEERAVDPEAPSDEQFVRASTDKVVNV